MGITDECSILVFKIDRRKDPFWRSRTAHFDGLARPAIQTNFKAFKREAFGQVVASAFVRRNKALFPKKCGAISDIHEDRYLRLSNHKPQRPWTTIN